MRHAVCRCRVAPAAALGCLIIARCANPNPNLNHNPNPNQLLAADANLSPILTLTLTLPLTLSLALTGTQAPYVSSQAHLLQPSDYNPMPTAVPPPAH